MKPARALALTLALALVACTHVAPPAAAAAKAPADDTPHGTTTRSGDVGTYVSIPWGFSTRSYWIEGESGLVAIDTQFLPSAAEEMIAQAEAMTHKRFVLAIVLHANPDKFNGTATFQKHGVKVVTSAQVKALFPEVHAKRLRAFYDRYAPDYPRELPSPDVFGNATTDLTIAGVPLRLHVLGPACSEAHVVVERLRERSIFVGDMVASKSHSWLEIGKTDQWLERLAELKKLAPQKVYPGRGPAGGPELLGEEKAYLENVVALVASEKPTLPIAEDAVARVEKKVVDAYPGYLFPVFLKIGLPAEFERQARLR